LRTQVCSTSRRCRRAFPIVGVAAFLSGCWVPPSADVHPAAQPGVVAGVIEVERVADLARVVSIDRHAGTLRLSEPGIPVIVARIGRAVRHADTVRAGDEVRVTIKEALTVYIPSGIGGTAPDAAARSRGPDARVLVVDPSYRLLTVRYASGRKETFKVGLHTPMQVMAPGDSVAIRSQAVIDLHVRRHAAREGSRPSPIAPVVG
jgi:hypothetical protein